MGMEQTEQMGQMRERLCDVGRQDEDKPSPLQWTPEVVEME